MTETSPAVLAPKATHRSRITNRSAVLPGVDHRSVWMRRLRDLIEVHVADLGGDAVVSAAERSVVRRAATMTVELERMEAMFAIAGEATSEQLDLYSRVAGNLRRLLESVGMSRRPRDVTPNLQSYLTSKAAKPVVSPSDINQPTTER
jgi:hypothetical protein